MYLFTSTILNSAVKSKREDHLAITFSLLSLPEIYNLADNPANDAIVVLSGTVRNQTDGIPVTSLEYQAYEPMAMRVFYQIAAEIRNRWTDINRVVIHHRTGHLKIG